jgi:hypothetical protein
MSKHDPLTGFIDHARAKGLDHPTIRTILLSVGWKDKQINEALITGQLDMAVPLPADVGGARQAFVYLLTFSLLHVAAVALVTLYFTYINRLFPDPAWESSPFTEIVELTTIRMALAAAIIAFPLYLALSILLARDIGRNPDHARSPIRRWLTYLTLFIAAATITSDAVTLLYFFLDGQLSMRVLLKGVILMLLGCLVLAYYGLGLREVGAVREVEP